MGFAVLSLTGWDCRIMYYGSGLLGGVCRIDLLGVVCWEVFAGSGLHF